MGISDEAVRAAWEAFCANGDDDMQAALEAAAPHIAAAAWAEGHEDGFWNGRLSHGDSEALTGIEHAKATNPYRSQV